MTKMGQVSFRITQAADDRPRILVVDDAPEALNILLHALKDDYAVVGARSGLKALQLVAAGPPPDLILLDIVMQEMDGYQVCKHLKENEATRAIPIIFLTSLEDEQSETLGFNAGAVDFIRKPVRVASLQLRVRLHLELHRIQRCLEKQNDELVKATRLREDVENVSAAARELLRISESRYRRLFETALDGILLINVETGQIEDANPYLLKILGYSHTKILGKKLWEIGAFADVAQCKAMFEELQTKGYVRYENLPLNTASGGQVEVEFVSNSYSCEGIRVIQCNIRDISDRKIAEINLARQSKLYAALSRCNKAIVHSTSEEELFPQICRAAVQCGGMRLAWIGMIDRETNMVRPAASFGDDAGSIRDITISISADSPFGLGPTGTAIRDNQAFWCQDFQNDPLTAAWRDFGGSIGLAALASLPLIRNGQVVGAFIVHSEVANCFDEPTRDLLVEMAADIGFALDNFTGEAQRRQAEYDLRAAEEKFHGLVEQAIAGIFIIHDGRLIYVNPRGAEIFGQGSADELIGAEPFCWVVEADRPKVVAQMQRLLEGQALSVAFDFCSPRQDGITVLIGANAARATHLGGLAIIGMVQDISEKKRAEDEIGRYVAQLRTALKSTVEVATIISEMRDPYTAGHERRVAEIAVAIGAELGFDAVRQEGLQVAGHLHDVGKIIIPSEILSKPGKLSSIEFMLIQGHAQASCDVLKGVEFPWPVAQVAMQHHERMDGSGYPQGLKGEEILLEARIMAVADVVEAMSSHRPYRPALGIEKALAEIERGGGTAYDADVVNACLHLFRDLHFLLPA